MSYSVFDRDKHSQQTFQQWLREHESGFVLNCNKNDDCIIHQSYCGHLKRGRRDNSLGFEMKVGFDRIEEAHKWLKQNAIIKWNKCKHCMFSYP